jgi:hypothetical protein
MQRFHLANVPDPRFLVLQQEDIRRIAAEGVSDELVQGVVHQVGFR